MLEPDDESLPDWYASREKRRRPVGTRDAVPLVPGPRRAAHLFQDFPRLVVEWDGHTWQPVAVTDSYAEAYPLIMRREGELIPPQEDTPVRLLQKGNGRHRRP